MEEGEVKGKKDEGRGTRDDRVRGRGQKSEVRSRGSEFGGQKIGGKGQKIDDRRQGAERGRWVERGIFISILSIISLVIVILFMKRRKQRTIIDVGEYPIKHEIIASPPPIDQAQVEAAVRTVINDERIRRMEEKLERIEAQGMKYLKTDLIDKDDLEEAVSTSINKTLSEEKFVSQESIREMLKTGVCGVKENLDKIRIDMERWEDGLNKFQKITT